ncbi:MAG: hypothetical protein KAZ26_24400 [Caldilineaceae bacterium]|nr:hypothetical protein [Caldilineaceae bacterium]
MNNAGMSVREKLDSVVEQYAVRGDRVGSVHWASLYLAHACMEQAVQIQNLETQVTTLQILVKDLADRVDGLEADKDLEFSTELYKVAPHA